MTQIIGRIYKITSSQCDGCYIGSTTQQLNRRLIEHKSNYKRHLNGNVKYVSSVEVCKFVDAQIELVHEGLFESTRHMEQYEGETIRCTPHCINKNIVGRSRTQYSQDNKEQICDYKAQYYKDNKDKIKQRRSTKSICQTCGGKYTLANKSHHAKTKQHQDACSTDSSTEANDV